MIRVFRLGRHEMMMADEASVYPQINAGTASSEIEEVSMFPLHLP